jgi:hypothetical protein
MKENFLRFNGTVPHDPAIDRWFHRHDGELGEIARHGASLSDPARLLHGEGKYMRHVKLKPGSPVNIVALGALIVAAWLGMEFRVENG